MLRSLLRSDRNVTQACRHIPSSRTAKAYGACTLKRTSCTCWSCCTACFSSRILNTVNHGDIPLKRTEANYNFIKKFDTSKSKRIKTKRSC